MIADPTMGMSRQAATLLTALSTLEPHTAAYINGAYQIHTLTVPFSNCRERGFVLQIAPEFAQRPRCLAFFEHRNSDSLCCVMWTADHWSYNTMTADDIPHDAWPSKYDVTRSWPYMSIAEAEDFVLEIIREVCGTPT